MTTLRSPVRIAIVGGGYVGMYTALSLQRELSKGRAQITVIDPQANMTYQPFLPEGLVPSAGVYQAVLAAQFGAAVLVVAGRGARPALLVAAGLLVYTMLCDRLSFHHYRHTMAAFSTLLAFAPCDRHFVLGRVASEAPGPLWAQNAIRAQVSVMYLASGGSKLLDPEWRGGLMMLGMVKGLSPLLVRNHFPASLVAAMQTPLGGSLLAKVLTIYAQPGGRIRIILVPETLGF